jgi:predicted ArsR family transcriptional regulator
MSKTLENITNTQHVLKHVDGLTEQEADEIVGLKRQAVARREDIERRGEIRLTVNQRRVLAALLALRSSGSHAYALARELEIPEDTVRGALTSLVKKGLVRDGEVAPSSAGPARNMYYVLDEERADATIAAEIQRRDDEINQISKEMAQLSTRLAALMKN